MKPVDLQALLNLLPASAWQNVEVQPDDPRVFQAAIAAPALAVQGLVVGSMSGTPVPGQIQYTGGVFQGWNGTTWVALSSGGLGAPDTWFDNAVYLAPQNGLTYPIQSGNAQVNHATTPSLILDRSGAIPTTPGETIGLLESAVGVGLCGYIGWVASEVWSAGAKGSTFTVTVTPTGTTTPVSRLQLGGGGAAMFPNTTGVRIGDLGVPREKLDVLGAVVLGASTAGSPADGTLQYTGTKFQGRVAGAWVDIPGAGGGGGTNYWQPGIGGPGGSMHTLTPIDVTQDVFVGPSQGVRFASGLPLDPTNAAAILGSGASLLIQLATGGQVIVQPGGTNAVTIDANGVNVLHSISVGGDIQGSPRAGSIQFDATYAFRGWDGVQWIALSSWQDGGTYLTPRQGGLYPINVGNTSIGSTSTAQLQLNAVVGNPVNLQQLSYLYTLVSGLGGAVQIVSAAQNWAAGNHGTTWELQVVHTGATSLQQRLVVNGAGGTNFPNTTGVRIGDTTTARERLDVLGAIIMGASTAGSPAAGTCQWNGTHFQGYTGSGWVNLDGAAAAVISATAPSSPYVGQLWWRTTDGNLYIYYFDGSTSQFVPAMASVGKLVGGTFYVMSGSRPGAPTASLSLSLFVASQAFTLPVGLTGSQGIAKTAATAQTDVNILVNGVSKGTMRWAAAGTVATFIFASAVAILAGDRIELVAPATPDTTLAGLGWTIQGNL